MTSHKETMQIKQQVFQVISNKYSHGQTERLIEDMDKITKAITDEPAQMAVAAPEQAPKHIDFGTYDKTEEAKVIVLPSDMNKDELAMLNELVSAGKLSSLIRYFQSLTPLQKHAALCMKPKPQSFLFFGGYQDGRSNKVMVDSTGKPTAENIAYDDPKNTYYLNSMTAQFDCDGSTHTYYFYSLKENYVPSSPQAEVHTLKRLVDFYQAGAKED